MSRARHILERVSDILFHATSRENALSILQQNLFHLKHTGVDGLPDTTREYCMSAARSKTNGFFQDGACTAVLVLDGNKFNDRYTGHAVDWMAGTDKYRRSEMEDRIFSDKPEIPNARTYVREVHVSLLSGYGIQARKVVYDIHVLCHNLNIPFYGYTNEAEFKDMDKRFAASEELLMDYFHGDL